VGQRQPRRRRRRQCFDLGPVYRFDQRVAGRKMAISRSDREPGLPCNVVQIDFGAVARERGFGDLQQAIAIALRVSARLSSRTGLVGRAKSQPLTNGEVLRILFRSNPPFIAEIGTIRKGRAGNPCAKAGKRRELTQPFGATSTTDDVLAGVSLRGKRVFVTGVSAGLGVETARALAAHGATVVGAARDLAKARDATASVRDAAKSGGGGFEIVELDLASLASVRACADRLNGRNEPFDLVIANAGVMATPFGHAVDGFETSSGPTISGILCS
jgi:hypothetical protein